MHVFDRLGPCSFFILGGSPGLLFVVYSLANFFNVCSLWCPFGSGLLFRGTPILAGGIGVARFCGVGSFCLLCRSWIWLIFMSVLLLIRIEEGYFHHIIDLHSSAEGFGC